MITFLTILCLFFYFAGYIITYGILQIDEDHLEDTKYSLGLTIFVMMIWPMLVLVAFGLFIYERVSNYFYPLPWSKKF